MGHNIYTTEGVVLGSYEFGEADKFFRIFTKEFGLIEAIAKGIRKISSKNRYGLQDFSVSNFSLVRGRDVWRITNVAPQENLYFTFNNIPNNKISVTVEDSKKFNTVLNIFSSIKRFIHGEEKNEYLYDLILDVISFLKNNNLKDSDFQNLDLIISVKILNNLGYFDGMSQKDIFSNFLKNKIDKDLIFEMNKTKLQTEKVLREVIEDSHL